MEKGDHASNAQKKAGEAILVQKKKKKVHFRTKTIARDKEEHYIMKKGSH